MSDMPPPPPPPPPGPMGGPPSPQLGLPRPAELLDRFLARLIDGLILGVVYAIIYFILSVAIVGGYATRGELLFLYIFLGPLTAAAWIGYTGYLESSQGATVGKMLMKLKVVGPDGVNKPTMEQAVRRNIWLAVPLIFIVPFIGVIVGWLVILVAEIAAAVTINNDTVNRHGWHDNFAGGTTVLKIG